LLKEKSRMKTSGRIDASPIKVRVWAWCLLGLAFWQVLLGAQNPSLMSDDSGEMIAASYCLGLAHPPAYPLFCLLGRLFSVIPVGTVAFRFNLLSSLFILFSFYFLGEACLAFTPGKKAPPVWFAVSACFFSLVSLFSCRSIFSQALTAKGCVYTLTLLFLSVFLWMRVSNYKRGLAPQQALLVLFLASLGLANHWESEVLWMPFIALWFYQEKVQWDMRRIFQGFSLILTGLSLYLYLPLRSALGARPAWGDPQTLRNFMWVVKREAFSEPGTQHFLGLPVYAASLRQYFEILSVYWIPGFAAAALIGLCYLWRRERPLFYSTLAFYLPVIFGVLTVMVKKAEYLMTVFLVPTQGLVFFWGFIGIFLILRKLLEIHFKILIAAVVFLFGAGLFWTFLVFKREDKSRYYLASDFSINALKLLPSKSILLAEGDNYVVPLFYQRFVLGLRPDMVFIPSIFLAHPWGWNQLAEQNPLVAAAIQPTMLYERMEGLRRVQGSGGFFNTMDQSYLGTAATNIAWTPWALEKVWVKTAPNPHWVSGHVFKLAGTERFRGLDADYGPEDVTTFEIHHYYANQFFSTALWLHAKGDSEDALRCFEGGLPFYPKAAYAYNYMAAIVGGEGYLRLAGRLCLLGIEADPAYFGSYENLANVYRQQGDWVKAEKSYQWGLSRVSDPDTIQRHIQALEKMVIAKPQTATRDKSPGDYQVLADRFQKEGLVFLSGLARQEGQAGR
jgi:tetratricopeptide (TPR) repeat protein